MLFRKLFLKKIIKFLYVIFNEKNKAFFLNFFVISFKNLLKFKNI